MKLHVLGSSSAGNCYIIGSSKEQIIIEAGIHLKHVKQSLNFDFSKVSGCIITHEHGDHAKYANDLISLGVNCYSGKGTFAALNIKNNRAKEIKSLHKYKIGNFTVMPFDVKHDAAEPFGYLITHPEIGNLLFATDTYYLPYVFKNLNHILIECNYSIDILNKNVESEKIPLFVRTRILNSHMEFETTKQVLKDNDLTNVHNIVLIHLSAGNANPERFKKEIESITYKNTFIAKKGLVIELNKNPF